MKRARAALAIPLMLAAGVSPAQTTDGGNIRYIFPTLLVPEIPADKAKIVAKKDPWFGGKIVPVRAAVLDSDVAITGTDVVLPAGTVMSIAISDYMMACQDHAVVPAGLVGTGRLPVCLIDLDRDGKFDGWFKSSIMITWGCCNGHLERRKITPIQPVDVHELSAKEVRNLAPWGMFKIRYIVGKLTYCVGLSDVCLVKAPHISPTAEEQVTEFMGGSFAYRRIEDGRLAVRMVRDPKEDTY